MIITQNKSSIIQFLTNQILYVQSVSLFAPPHPANLCLISLFWYASVVQSPRSKNSVYGIVERRGYFVIVFSFGAILTSVQMVGPVFRTDPMQIVEWAGPQFGCPGILLAFK